MADVAASFQEAVCDVLTPRRSPPAARRHETPGVGGGVAANSRLRGLAAERAARHGSGARAAPGLCTDNGAMVAALGAEWSPRAAAFVAGPAADSSLPVTTVLV